MSKFFKPSLPVGIIGIVLNLVLFISNGYYTLVIPVFEKTIDDGPLFTAIDELVFYTPCIFMALFAAYLIAGLIYKKNHHYKEEDRVTEELIVKNAAIQSKLDAEVEYLKHEYYRNCPSCGSARADGQQVCAFCGKDLIKQ